jgi:ubiquinone/menaquinone biosynthesis C-methylase UbiE
MNGVDLGSKEDVRNHWEREVCGSRWGAAFESDRSCFFDEIDRSRYKEDYMLAEFADFASTAGRRVLEVGLGTGADFIRWVRAGADAYGRDLTHASVALVDERLGLEGRTANVAVGDAEQLEFPDNFFDIYYSWGVLHHTPNPAQAFKEAFRVLRPGGTLKAMLYHCPSVGSWGVWLVKGPLKLRFCSLRECLSQNVESPGTSFYTIRQAREMVGGIFSNHPVEIRTYLGSGDLLSQIRSARYRGAFWDFVQTVYPRWFVKVVLGHRCGTVMTITTTK